MFDYVRSIGLEPLEWSSAVKATRKGSPYPGEVLDKAFAKASAVIVLLTPDDEVQLKKITA
jgi:predicted nucleotide-binding protein with TIR-like domain